MHALIIGGGLAGPLTGLALAKIGVRATVYEAYPAPARSAGSWLTLAVNGLAALRTLGIHGEVMAAGFPSQDVELVNGAGKLLGALPIGGRLADGTVTHTIKRGELQHLFTRAAERAGVRFEYGKRLASAHADAEVVARFADGSDAHGDLLVGADGLWSRTRTIIDPAAPGPRYAGLGNIGGFTPPLSDTAGGALAPGIYRMVFGRRCFFGYTVAPSGEIWWFANPPRAREPDRADVAGTTRTTEEWKERLCALFRDDRGPMVDIIRGSAGPIAWFSQYDLPRVPTWRSGRMTLLGDAAHAVSPSSGQGASMAAEDAVALARSLSDHRDVPAALAAFEAARRPRVERVVAYGARLGSTKTVGPVGRVVRDLVLPFFLRQQARRAAAGTMAWLFDHEEAVDAAARAA